MIVHLVQHLGPHQNVCIFCFVILIWPFVGHWEEQNFFVAQEILKIIEDISGLLLVMQDKKVRRPGTLVNGSKYNGIQTSGQALESNAGRFGRANTLSQSLNKAVTFVDVQKIIRPQSVGKQCAKVNK
jgi:hypothetical protein